MTVTAGSAEKTDLIPEGLSARMISRLTGTITTVSTGWCTTRGHNLKSRWSKALCTTAGRTGGKTGMAA
ncbi:hypothetical protein ACNKHU_24800 [Shigella flexneri]